MDILPFIRTITIIFVYYCIKASLASDTIRPGKPLYDHNGGTLVSSGETFELGFFSPNNSTTRYVGIWYKKIGKNKTVVWVANRNKPLKDTSGVLTIDASGNVVIRNNGSSTPVWSTSSSEKPRSPILQLLDTGNLVVKDGNDGSYIWQSFNYPCETVGFQKLSKMKLPDNSHILNNNITMDLTKCRDFCSKNSSCVAYASTKVSACVWFGNLLGTKQYHDNGQDLYIKVACSEPESNSSKNGIESIVPASVESKRRKKRTIFIFPGCPIIVILLLCLISYYVGKRESKRNPVNLNQDFPPVDGDKDLDLPIFDIETIANAADNFSFRNKIGEGGFGSVYKGKLPTGQAIAVKRLSKYSGQGLKEFQNEVIMISKLQHRNLVKLLGCCFDREEKMLIYEYMPHRSLDYYIFDSNRDRSLDWKMRFEIIMGIARGLLYLHHDSRLRIIHRDLKASNILLDGHMNPKISDFGLAKSFGGDQTEANTSRIIGTYGYMSPEYVVDGLFSTKSDVFSFGVLVLEIVSGKKNRGFFHPDHDLNLLGHAWNLWNKDRPLELVDRVMGETLSVSELLRCIQVGLLCVQQRPEDRPTMSSVLLMLASENSSLPQPKLPGFCTERFFSDKYSSSTGDTSFTSIELTVTMPHGR